MAVDTARKHTCQECGIAVRLPLRAHWWGRATFRCPQCETELRAEWTRTRGYWVGIAAFFVVTFSLQNEGLWMWLGIWPGTVALELIHWGWLLAFFGTHAYLARDRIQVRRYTGDKPVQTWLDRTTLGRAFSGSEWDEKDGGSGDTRRQG